MSNHKPNHRCPDGGAHFLLVQCVVAALLQLLLVPALSVYMEFVFNDKTNLFFWAFYGFIDSTAEDMTGNREREREGE